MDHNFFKRIKRLVNNEILAYLDFIDFGTYMDYINSMQTTKNTKSVRRSSKILEIIHTKIDGPFSLMVLIIRDILSNSLIIVHNLCISTLFDKTKAFDTFKINKVEADK